MRAYQERGMVGLFTSSCVPCANYVSKQLQGDKVIVCDEVVTKRLPHCEHEMTVKCVTRESLLSYR